MRLSVGIYKHNGNDCSNGGDSHWNDNAILVWDETLEEYCKNPVKHPCVLFLVKGYGSRKVMAVPRDEFIESHNMQRSFIAMNGGCFIYTSDSRFPSDSPIFLHDRFE